MVAANPRALDTALWNRGCVNLSGAATPDEVISRAGLDWHVEKQPLMLPSGAFVPKRFATVRADKVNERGGGFLGVVSDRFTAVSNRQCVELAASIVNACGAKFERSGLVGFGRKTFLLASLPDPVAIVPADEVMQYLIFVNAFDGSTAFRAVASPIRISCANQIRVALAGGQGISIRHHRDIGRRIADADGLARRLKNDFTQGTRAMQAMATTDLDASQVHAYFQNVFPMRPGHEATDRIQQLRSNAEELFETGLGSEIPAGRGSLYRAMQAVIELVEHRPINGRMKDPAAYSLLGAGAAVKERAFRTAMSYLNASLN